MRNLMTACIIAGLILMLCLGGAAGQFGERVTNSSPEVGLIVEDFASNKPFGPPFSFVQTPVQIGYWDIGPNWALFDEDDVLYLNIGGAILLPGASTPIKVNDIRLTNSAFGPAGSKVGAANADMGQLLTAFPVGLPRIVFVDEGGTIRQYDINDSVYIKTVFPLGNIRTGDIRLSPSPSLAALPGTMVLGIDPDYDAHCIDLHPGPNFNFWPFPLARGQIRFYNANGNIYIAPGAAVPIWPSPPIYDQPDDVYFDVSSPSFFPRNFGHITPNAIRMRDRKSVV